MEVAVKNIVRAGGAVMERKGEQQGSVKDRIAYYASLSPEQVDIELQKAGIDPAPTIEAIDKLMREKLSAPAPVLAAK